MNIILHPINYLQSREIEFGIFIVQKLIKIKILFPSTIRVDTKSYFKNNSFHPWDSKKYSSVQKY